MPSPFPGMDPYLERPRDWRHVHNMFAGAVCDALNASLPPEFYAMVEERLEILPERPGGRRGGRYDDVGVLRRKGSDDLAAGAGTATAARTALTQPRRVTTREPATLLDVEVFHSREGKTTHIELLSPANKSGEGREKFLKKRRGLLASDLGVVEIDLLRGGDRPCEDADGGPTVWVPAGTSYVVLVSRGWERHDPAGGYDVDGFFLALDEELPVIGVPLREGTPDAPVDLQHCLNVMYDRGPFRRAPERFYDAPPVPPLPPDSLAWAEARLAAWRTAR